MAYGLAAARGRAGETYNVCSGKGNTIKHLIDLLLGFSDVEIEVRVDKARLRAVDTPIMVGDYSKFAEHTGWKPEIKIKDTIKDILDYWRQRV